MKVVHRRWGSKAEVELSEALTVGADYDTRGVAESAQETADKAAAAMGKLLAWHVENGQMTLDEAATISGVYGIEPIY